MADIVRRFQRAGGFRFAALALLALLVVRPAAGQGTDGSLPDPISTPQLTGYADRLGLSPQQRIALQQLHDVYREEFRALRETRIAAFLAETNELQGRMPKRERLAEVIETLEDLQKEIKIVDDRFLDRLQPLLTAEQAAMLPRIRLKRERERYESQQIRMMMQISGRTSLDLSDIVTDLGLSADAAAIVDPALAAYENRLTRELRDIHDAILRLYLDMFDAIEDAGFGDFDVTDRNMDPQELQRFTRTMQEVFADLQAGVRERAMKISELDRRTARSIETILEPADARAFRTRYLMRAYPEIAFALPAGERAWMAGLPGVEGLSAEERRVIEGTLAEVLGRLDRIADEAIEIVDKQRAAFSPFGANSDLQAELRKEMEALRVDAGTAVNTAENALTEALGDERFVELVAAVGAASEPAEAAAGVNEDEAEPPIPAPGPFLSAGIAPRDVRRFARILDLTDDDREVLDALYIDYGETYRQLPDALALRRANGSLWRFDPERGESMPPTEEALAEVDRLRRAAAAATAAADDAFFAEIAALVGEERADVVERLRLGRQRARNTRQSRWSFGGRLGSAEAQVDLIGIVEKAGLSRDDRRAIEPALLAFERAARDPYATWFEAQLDLHAASEGWQAQWRNRASGADLAEWRRYQELVEPLADRVSETRAQLAALNRAALEEIASRLDPRTARALRRSYLVKAYPTVYVDPVCIERQVASAIDLEDLTPSQREALAELSVRYLGGYDDLSGQMVGRTLDDVNVASFEADDWREYQKRQRELDRLRYERDELSFRTAARLRAVLTEAQLLRIGGLPTPPTEQPNAFSP